MDHRILLIVANQPVDQKEEEYNIWYNGAHIPMLLAFKGTQKAARYRNLEEDTHQARYLAMYEFDSRESLKTFFSSSEFEAAVRDFESKWKKGEFRRKWEITCELIRSWER